MCERRRRPLVRSARRLHPVRFRSRRRRGSSPREARSDRGPDEDRTPGIFLYERRNLRTGDRGVTVTPRTTKLFTNRASSTNTGGGTS